MKLRRASARLTAIMLLIVWSLTAALLDHARRPPATIPSLALAHAHSPVALVVNRVRDLSESVVNAMVTETAAIWRPLGVELRRPNAGTRARSRAGALSPRIAEPHALRSDAIHVAARRPHR
jgi:hypothetical protein